MSDPAKYRTKDELESYKAQDPIERVKTAILNLKLATPEELAEIDVKVKNIVAESVKFAEESPYPAADAAYEDLYSEEGFQFTVD